MNSEREAAASDRSPTGGDRAAAFAALRRMSELAREEIAEEGVKRLWARRLGWAIAALAAAVLLTASIDPGALRDLFRAVTGMAR